MNVRFTTVQQYPCERIPDAFSMNDCFFQRFISETPDFERETSVVEGLNDIFMAEIAYIWTEGNGPHFNFHFTRLALTLYKSGCGSAMKRKTELFFSFHSPCTNFARKNNKGSILPH